MAYSLPFSALNERLRPRISTNDRLYASLYRMEYGCAGSLRTLPSYYRPSVLPSKVESTVSETVAEPEEPKADAEQEVCNNPEEEEPCTENPCLTEVNLKDGEEQEDEDSQISPSEEKDVPGELTSEGTDASPQPADGEAPSSLQRSYIDETLPDLIRSGRPLGRRRTLGHVSETLQEVRREVALSRKRSIKLKAQVDKLQESQEGQGWSQHRERVTEEVLSVLRLLSPLAEPETNIPDPSHREIQLDTALFQLQNVARKLAMSHSPQVKCSKGAENNAILQQALYDRDEAISKKKAMEAELLRSKTEMMLLNNHLLEAVQKRLELSLELEAWKEDVQVILHQQVQSQQQAEQKKASRVGLLRRHNKPPIQRPSPAAPANQIVSSNSTASAAPTPSTPSLPPPTGTQRNWRDKLRRGWNSRQADQEPDAGRMDNSFKVISLD